MKIRVSWVGQSTTRQPTYSSTIWQSCAEIPPWLKVWDISRAPLEQRHPCSILIASIVSSSPIALTWFGTLTLALTIVMNPWKYYLWRSPIANWAPSTLYGSSLLIGSCTFEMHPYKLSSITYRALPQQTKNARQIELCVCAFSIPHICHRHHRRWLCKKILSSVKFSRLNAKNCIFYTFWGYLL